MRSSTKLSALAVSVFLASTVVLSGCSTEGISRSAVASACEKSAEAAATGYANATSPAAQEIADAALNTTLEAAANLAGTLEGVAPDASANLRARIEAVRTQRTLADPLNGGIVALSEQRESVSASLRELGQTCAQSVNAIP